MWGNVQGWIISLALLCLLMFGMHELSDYGLISEPTAFGKDPANLATVELPVAPSSLIDPKLTEPTQSADNIDAKSLYRAAIEDYVANHDEYDRLTKSTYAPDAKKLKGLANLLQASRARKATLFADTPVKIVTYRDKPELAALAEMGHLAARAGLLEQAKNPTQAGQYFLAEFCLGARLYEERLTVEEFSVGLELMAESSAALTRLFQKTGDASHAAAFHAFDEARQKYFAARVQPMLKVLQSIDANVIGEHAGDIFYFARHCSERMYRVEAILAMGRLRFFVGDNGRIGDQRGAMQELKRLTESSDPIIAQAAHEAQSLTLEQYRMMR